MNFDAILEALSEEEAVVSLAKPSISSIAIADCAQAWAIASYVRLSERKTVFVATPTIKEASILYSDMCAILGADQVGLFPAWETLPFERVSPALTTMGQRVKVLWQLKNSCNPKVIVSPIRAVTQLLAADQEIEPITITTKEIIDLDTTMSALVRMGYRRVAQVEHRGEVAKRGSILDVYPTTADSPVRIDLWGDEVDRLVEFSVSDQLTVSERQRIQIFPAREILPTGTIKEQAENLVSIAPWGRSHWEKFIDGETFDGMESWLPWVVTKEEIILDYLPDNSRLFIVDPVRSKSRMEEISDEEGKISSVLSQTWEIGEVGSRKKLHTSFERAFAQSSKKITSLVALFDSEDSITMDAQPWKGSGPTGLTSENIKAVLDQGYSVQISANSLKSHQVLSNLVERRGIEVGSPEQRTRAVVQIIDGPISKSVIFPSRKILVITEDDFMGRRRMTRTQQTKGRDAKVFYEDLQAGSYVVHEHHGVALYKGIVSQPLGSVERDYLLLEYRKGDKLYVPAEQINQIRPYTGGSAPALSRMGGSDWNKTKTRVRSEIQKIVHELVDLYKRRVSTDGYAFSPDTPWQREVEDSFPFQETPDQLLAIQEVKGDMEHHEPMDRLVCGGVGFGKTEIALRAAFKAIQDNKQVAVLVPTTLLAQQHFQTFSSRLSNYPIQIEVLSRFLSSREKTRVVNQLAAGKVDLVIGTHRLLSEDIAFDDLGLLIIDEEQRFGVKHKEKLKAFKSSIDVLTLSATPIPRTLEMSLTGIRDLTILNTPPVDRQPILTFVGEYETRVIVAAIRRELLREGQVFFVHNRVMDIDKVAESLRNLVPEAKIAVAHGQMDERKLEKVVTDFWEGAYDVLVCTTIIESGIDMPTVNTLIVGSADRLGLGQLHQLRGRVGRSGSRAYAYLLTPKGASLGDVAYERLRTIGESTELGSGFKIAMRDLEIRGAGNLLGLGQSGHVASVGYDLYCQLVTEAVATLKGEPIKSLQEVSIELPVSAHIPFDYISKEDLRLEAYRKLSICKELKDVTMIQSEWVDRFGAIPDAASNLLSVARLRCVARKHSIAEISGRNLQHSEGAKWVAKLSPINLRPSEVVKVKRLHAGSVFKESLSELHIVFNRSQAPVQDLVDYLQGVSTTPEISSHEPSMQ